MHRLMNLYFLLTEFKEQSWILIACIELSIFIYLLITIHILVSNGIEKCEVGKRPRFVLQTATNMILRTFFNKATNNGFQSKTYKMNRLVLSVLGFVILTYYKAMLNAALNVDVNNLPFKSWEEVANSNYKVLVLMGTVNEEYFKFGNDIKQKIYREKIITVRPVQQLQNIGVQGSIEAIVSDKYIVSAADLLFKTLDEYPCEVIEVHFPELR